MKKYSPYLLVIFLVILADQALKFYVKLNIYPYQTVSLIGDFFTLHMAENPGMAFSMQFGGEYGKLFLTVFRIFGAGLMIYFLIKLVRTKAHWGLITCLALVLGGTIGNIIDCVFYGVIFSKKNGQLGELFPAGGGYETWFHGHVVDMFLLHFFTIEHVPDWVPFIGNGPFMFFDAIFNIADAAICVGIVCIIIFQRKFFPDNTAVSVQ